MEVIDSGGKILQQQQQKKMLKKSQALFTGEIEKRPLFHSLEELVLLTSTNYGIYRHTNLKTVVWNRTRNCRMLSECDNWSAEYCAS